MKKILKYLHPDKNRGIIGKDLEKQRLRKAAIAEFFREPAVGVSR